MYMNICGVSVRDSELLGIFDMDAVTVGRKTMGLLKRAGEQGTISNEANDLPKSFVLCTGPREVVLSGATTRILRKR
ncbi:MAG: DUF370 domain-containing protein [Oscillospiraceae bacterium]|jgi:hypothetical protein